MSQDLYNNPDLQYDSYLEQDVDPFVQQILATTAITSINGISGPTVTFTGGTSGFSFVPGGTTLTLVSPITTKGDLYTWETVAGGVRLGVGANGDVLTADSTTTKGIKWAAPATSGTVTHTGALTLDQIVLGNGAADIKVTTTGTGVVTALGVNVGTAGAFVVNGGALGTPLSGVVTNLTGTAGINITGTAPAGTLTGTTLNATVVTSSLTTLGTLTGLTINSATVTLSQDTDFVTSGGVNGFSIDGTTFSVDGTNNRVGIGTAAPGATLEVAGNIFIANATGFMANNNQCGTVVRTAGLMEFYNGNVVRMAIDTSGNVGINTSTFGTSAGNVLAIKNGTEPSTSPADTVQIYSVDLSAGNATLGLRTETAVVTESVTSDRTLSVRINGTTYKICLKA